MAIATKTSAKEKTVQQKIYRGTGRRKSAVASVIIKEGTGKRTINGRDFKDYFLSEVQNMVANLPFSVLGNAEKWDVIVNANGGGIAGQMGAVRLGIARALVEQNAEVKPALRHANLLTRDARVVERKKYGRKKARKRFQFSKR
ncbi:MAG: 30S ribosomal protein S9 [Fibromonadales bacterium]|jgi:small subunit ribosomal protein S9|nr:30S ribosomal protein S9 [Fibromonadales bacterium]MDR2554205.1 30S ribosomal protein S9 [Fibromonadaceae bacterium]